MDKISRQELAAQGIDRAVRMAWKFRRINRAKALRWIKSGRSWQEWEVTA